MSNKYIVLVAVGLVVAVGLGYLAYKSQPLPDSFSGLNETRQANFPNGLTIGNQTQQWLEVRLQGSNATNSAAVFNNTGQRVRISSESYIFNTAKGTSTFDVYLATSTAAGFNASGGFNVDPALRTIITVGRFATGTLNQYFATSTPGAVNNSMWLEPGEGVVLWVKAPAACAGSVGVNQNSAALSTFNCDQATSTKSFDLVGRVKLLY